MARHVKVAVAGDGADELFGSYLSHRVAAGAEALPDGLPSDPDWAWRAGLLVNPLSGKSSGKGLQLIEKLGSSPQISTSESIGSWMCPSSVAGR